MSMQRIQSDEIFKIKQRRSVTQVHECASRHWKSGAAKGSLAI